MKKIRNLGLILGDQLDLDSELFKHLDPKMDAIWMAEVHEESTHVWSHKHRIVLFLSAMRHFRDDLGKRGFKVIYQQLDHSRNSVTFKNVLTQSIEKYKPESLIMVEPGEWRVQDELIKTSKQLKTKVTILPDNHFLVSKKEFSEYYSEHPSLRMEFFYRYVRRKTNILMKGEQPEGGKWNYDVENRGSFNKKGPENLPPMPNFKPDKITKEVITLVEKIFPKHPGNLKNFNWPVKRDQALKMLDDFINHRFPNFGRYQDAMWTQQPFLYHSLISSSLNLKLIHPKEVIEKAVQSYKQKNVDLASTEGFIRQIMGWREYVRGVYWTFMPDYKNRNFLNAKEKLPSFYWDGNTHMNCMRESIEQTLNYGYAHHIQRLMVTGLFSLLLGVDPKEIHKWYLAVYVDAVEWVELPNTLGMSQYADGSIMGSKPYVATGKYINRMSNYCEGCQYKPDQSTGDQACPFTVLYWDFLMKHKNKLKNNNRMIMQLRNINRISAEKKKAIVLKAKTVRDFAQKTGKL